MKRYSIYSALIALCVAGGMSSCVEDEGSGIVTDINKITISGIESQYDCTSYFGTLRIAPTLTFSLDNIPEDKLEYSNEDFDFIYMLYEHLKSTRKHFQKNIILKREIKQRKIIKTKAIQILIAIFKQKIYSKRIVW